MKNILFNVMIACHRLVKGLANRILDKEFIRPRNFSNAMLRKYSKYFSGAVINVSGWKDSDGEGGWYRDYFNTISQYVVSNVGGQGKGLGSAGTDYQEIEIDLTKEIPPDLRNHFDVVFNHTTLEHVYECQIAFKHLCQLSKDIVIVVVPVMQQIHNTADFGDYWRPTTMTIAKLFLDNGFKPLVIKCNDQPFAPVYCFAIGSRKPEVYTDIFPEEIDFQMGAYSYGSSIKKEYIRDLL
ncbi:MAG: hypothetical protein NUV60_00510 [Patescibacteria group bacterium]|nr:hypothetical protein [Patescibacteria group bacterium]